MKAGPGIGSIGTVVALVAAICAGCGGETAVPAGQGDRQTQAQPSPAATDRPQSSRAQHPETQPAPAPKVIVRGVNPPTVAAPVATPEAVLPTPPPASSPTPSAAAPPIATLAAASTTPQTPVTKGTAGAVTIEKDSVIGIRLDHPLDSKTARIDDKITAHVARDVVASGRVVIPAGAQLEGTVVLVERNRDGRDLPKVGVRFQTLVLGETRRVAIQTDPIVRIGGSSGGPSSSFAANTAAGGTMVRGAPPPGRRASRAGSASDKPPVDVHVPAGSLLTLKLTAVLTIDR